MKTLKNKFIKEIKKELGYFNVWLPGKLMKLGDVGIVEKGNFLRITDLKNLGIKFNIRKDKTKNDIKYKSKNSVNESITVDGKVAEIPNPIGESEIAIEYKFNKEGAIVLALKGVNIDTIDDIVELEKNIKELKEWKRDWFVVTEVVNSDSATILISNSKSSKSKLVIGAKVKILNSIDIADTSLKLYSKSSDNMTCEMIAKDKLTLLFNMMKLKKNWFNGDMGLKVKSITINEKTDFESNLSLEKVDIEDLN